MNIAPINSTISQNNPNFQSKNDLGKVKQFLNKEIVSYDQFRASELAKIWKKRNSLEKFQDCLNLYIVAEPEVLKKQLDYVKTTNNQAGVKIATFAMNLNKGIKSIKSFFQGK